MLWRVVTAEKQITIDDTDSTQFMIWDRNTNQMVPMTDRNGDTYFWNQQEKPIEKPQTPLEKLISLIRSFFNWIKLAFARITGSAA